MEPLQYADVADRMRALKFAGVPLFRESAGVRCQCNQVRKDVADTLNVLAAEKNLVQQAQAGNYDGDRSRLTEMDALVAYLQMLGTLVDFSKYDEGYFAEFR